MTRYFHVDTNGPVHEITDPHDWDGSEITLQDDQFSFALGTGIAPHIVINDWFGPQPLEQRVRLVAAAADAMWGAL